MSLMPKNCIPIIFASAKTVDRIGILSTVIVFS